MKHIPQHIKNQLFKVLNDEVNIKDFEKWVYETKELEQILSEENYCELISFNYNQYSALDKLYGLFIELFTYDKFDTHYLFYQLNFLLEKGTLLESDIQSFLTDYYEGHEFIDGEFDDIKTWSKRDISKIMDKLNSGKTIVK
jgi:hypothetical protein